ncbi:GntR family transcriptional regulator [Cupriavidus necator]|uniref:GntR family transcriptional regulator n=1 Tax=Cupriavidus necator TaxID=106590 RepID=UPI003F73FDAB
MQTKFEPQLLQTLPLQIAEQLVQSIMTGSFSPGTRLREVELAEAFGVSRATIREALRLLEQRGLVKIQPQRGAHVTQLSAQELNDLYEVRASLLATGSALAAGRCTPEHIPVLHRSLDQMAAVIDDLSRYATLSGELVAYIMDMSGNVVLAAYVADFAQRIGRYIRMGLTTPERRAASMAMWRQIVDAIIAGDGEAAGAAHRKLALENRDAAMAEFARLESSPSPAAFPVTVTAS